MRRLAAAVLISAAVPSFAQPSNLELYQDMAIECLGGLTGSADSLAVISPERMPYLRSSLVNEWQKAGRVVYLADTTAVRFNLPRLSYQVERAAVEYASRGKQVERNVRLDLRYTMTGRDGLVIADDRCSGNRSDIIARTDIAGLQDPSYPETQAEPPPAGWIRRYLEPAVLTTATAIAVYLFFTLRSNAGDS